MSQAPVTAGGEQPGPADTAPETSRHAHPEPRQYVTIAVILAVITLAEVAIYYVDVLADLLVPFLIVFSLLKFILVVLWFMHLRFDSHVFRSMFLIGLVLAFVVFAIALVTVFSQGGPAPAVTG